MFTYRRTIRFHETDAAGVVYFSNVLTLCHEAYEASLVDADVDVKAFFGRGDVAIPVVHASVDFRRPLVCGDTIAICLTPRQIDDSVFEITYRIHPEKSDVLVATALTRHVCIQTQPRERSALTPVLIQWLDRFSATQDSQES